MSSRRGSTKTGGRGATTRFIPGEVALAVGRPPAPDAPEGWRWVKLSDVARMESGHTPSRKHPEYWDGEVPWIGIRDAKEHHGEIIETTVQATNQLGIENSSARVLPAGTVCLSRTASVGYVVVMGQPMATSQDFANWICSDELDRHFLKYLLLAERKSFARFASGATHQTIYYPELKAFHVCLPPLREQKRIVAILDAAFAGIDAATVNAEKNLSSAGELFESYLDVLVTRGDGNWPIQRLGDIATKIGSGATPRGGRNVYKSDGISLIRSLNVHDRRFTAAKLAFIDDEQAGRLDHVTVESGDVLFNITGASVARCCLAPEDALPARVNQHVAIIRPKPRSLDPRLLCYLLTARSYKDRLLGIGEGGSTRQAITKGQLQNFSVSFPEATDVQRKIIATLDELASETKRLELSYNLKLTSLGELKQSILQKAFSGELTTKEPDREMAAA